LNIFAKYHQNRSLILSYKPTVSKLGRFFETVYLVTCLLNSATCCNVCTDRQQTRRNSRRDVTTLNVNTIRPTTRPAVYNRHVRCTESEASIRK